MKIWQGKSLINGEPIMVCLSGLKKPSENRKTGPMVHAWILPVAEPMQVAVKTGLDAAVCGGCLRRRSVRTPPKDPTRKGLWELRCPESCSSCMACGPRGRPLGAVVDVHGGNGDMSACYVIPWTVPKLMHELHAKAPRVYYRKAIEAIEECGRVVRLGAVGDPTAVPLQFWKTIIPTELWGPTYTQRWREVDYHWRDHAMASVDTYDDAKVARDRGWRTFRVRTPILR